MATTGSLFVVAVPIGNYKDITLRALEILQEVDAVICEEYREGSTLLTKLKITNTLIALNEHTEQEEAPKIVTQVQEGRSFALISDAGTPIFSDPGHTLVSQLVQAGIPIIPVPGPSSLTAALSLCDFKIERFIYEGFLPRKSEQRRNALQKLRSSGLPVVLMEVPYRLVLLLKDVAAVFGEDQQIILACNLTLSNEQVLRGTVQSIVTQIDKRTGKYVLIIKSAVVTDYYAETLAAAPRANTSKRRGG